MYIGFCGLAGSGKDTAAAYLASVSGYSTYALASPIKKMLAAIGIYEPTRENKEKLIPEIGVSYRRLAQTLGTEWGRANSPDFWVNLAKTQVRGNVIFTDIRFENEAKMIRESGGILVLVEGRGGIAGKHASEAVGLLEPYIDYRIDNSKSMADLHKAVAALYRDKVRIA